MKDAITTKIVHDKNEKTKYGEMFSAQVSQKVVKFFIELKNKACLSIYQTNGTIVFQKTLRANTGYYNWRLNSKKYMPVGPGTYIAVLSIKNKPITNQIVVVN